MVDDEELQRRELSRLLSTAKDKDRQELILKAIHALDEQEKASSHQDSYRSMNFHGMSPSIHASLLMGENMPVLESITMTPGGSARMRPMSARRRPSVPNLLDAIPETAPRSMLANRNEEIVLPVEDIAEVVASSYDRRFPPKNIFRHGGVHRSSEFNSIANAQAAGGTAVDHYAPGASSSGHGGAYTPEVSALTSVNSHGAAPGSISASNSSSNLSIGGSSSSATAGAGPTVVVPVAQRRLTGGWAGPSASASAGGSDQHHQHQQHQQQQRSKGIKGWICSGMVPQFLHVAFFEKWEVKKIEVFCTGIERLGVQICASAAAAMKSGASAVDMVHMGKGAFVWAVGGTEDTFDNNVGGQPGISVTFLVRATNAAFIHISEIRIIAHPYT